MNQRSTRTLAHARGVADAIRRPDRLLRVSLGLVYLWCGALKVVGMSLVVEL